MKLFDKEERAKHVANDLDTIPSYVIWKVGILINVFKAEVGLDPDKKGLDGCFTDYIVPRVVQITGYILLRLPYARSRGGVPGNKNNKEINTGIIYTTVSIASQTRYHITQTTSQELGDPAEQFKLEHLKISSKLFDLWGLSSSHIMTQMVVDIFRPKYLHPPSC